MKIIPEKKKQPKPKKHLTHSIFRAVGYIMDISSLLSWIFYQQSTPMS